MTNELQLLLLRLEDLTESATNSEVKLLAKSLKRYFEKKEGTLGFSDETKTTRKS